MTEKVLTRPDSSDSKLLPTQIEQILMRVQNSANYMPEWQTEASLSSPAPQGLL